MHIESKFVPFAEAARFENDLRARGLVLVDKITEELQPGEYIKMGADAPENYTDGGITFVWKRGT